MTFLAVLAAWVAVLALLTALVAITAPAAGRVVLALAPRLVYAASFAWTWLALITAARKRA